MDHALVKNPSFIFLILRLALFVSRIACSAHLLQLVMSVKSAASLIQKEPAQTVIRTAKPALPQVRLTVKLVLKTVPYYHISTSVWNHVLLDMNPLMVNVLL